jgi:hypothetical protein
MRSCYLLTIYGRDRHLVGCSRSVILGTLTRDVLWVVQAWNGTNRFRGTYPGSAGATNT